jgi:hypothetical protein
MKAPPTPHSRLRWLTRVLALVLGLITAAAVSSQAGVRTITTCEAIGCGGRYFYCGSYGWGGPAPGARDCYTNRLPGQGS